MKRLDIKPLSLNMAYRGRRFATQELKEFKMHVSLLLPHFVVPEGKLSVIYRFGVSNRNCDGDNLIKALQDALSEKYGFNDNKVYKWQVEKVDVKKGEEFCEFEINML